MYPPGRNLTNDALRLKDLLERAGSALKRAFPSSLWVHAEVQDVRRHDNGHVYLALVDPDDARAKAQAKLWRSGGAARFQEEETARGEPLKRGEKVFLLVTPELHSVFGFSIIASDIHFSDTLGPRSVPAATLLLGFEERGC
jgi:exodeoxyribonuclease VII large subunit